MTNIAVVAAHADAVEVVLIDPDSGGTEAIDLVDRDTLTWHGRVHAPPGRLYGFRVHGPYRPEAGQRHNPRKLLLDPCARAITGEIRWGPEVLGYDCRRGDDLAPSPLDSAGHVPLSVVVDERFDWTGDRPPGTPLADTVIYETHVKGFTARMASVPERIRGTFAGLGHPAAIAHLVALGITAVELLPVQHFVDARHLVERGLRNYWGYDTIGYFAPMARYSSSGTRGEQVREFKEMVMALHAAGLEVILDVVYNHTGEKDHLGPTLCQRGIDNASYYRLQPHDRRLYVDVTGCGNSVNAADPDTLALILDSLRYWVAEMHVDGFRFDLAPVLTHDAGDRSRPTAFLAAVHQDPVLSRVKLIAEPWHAGPDGNFEGAFPPRWSEWNGRYRDDVRDFWRGRPRGVGPLAYRLTGSSDLFGGPGGAPTRSVNFVTCHDGFTLHDVVSYNRKHNLANGEDNRDGAAENRSWNCGVEGESDDPGVTALRARQQRNLLATLLLSQGVPMLLSGDELGRSQRGNNNAYCHDSELSWVDWENVDTTLLHFVRALLALRRTQPVLHRRHFFSGRRIEWQNRADVTWLGPDGGEMTDERWHDQRARSLAMVLDGDLIPDRDREGEPMRGDTVMVILHGGGEDIDWRMPSGLGATWEVVLDTDRPGEPSGGRLVAAGDAVAVRARSLVVLARREWPGGTAGERHLTL